MQQITAITTVNIATVDSHYLASFKLVCEFPDVRKVTLRNM